MAEFEQGLFGRFHIIVNDPVRPGNYIKFTYLLNEVGGTFLGQSISGSGVKPIDKTERSPVKETPAHRGTIRNFQRAMESLQRTELTEGLPTCNEPLTIWEKKQNLTST